MKLLLFLFTVNANATFTPIVTAPINYYAVGVLGKGELLTSNGVSNGTQAACADDEILVWDGSLPSGVKCEAKPASRIQTKVYAGANTDINGAIVGLTFDNLIIGNWYSINYHLKFVQNNFSTAFVNKVEAGLFNTVGNTTIPYSNSIFRGGELINLEVDLSKITYFEATTTSVYVSFISDTIMDLIGGGVSSATIIEYKNMVPTSDF